MIDDRATFLIECKGSAMDTCKIIIDSVKKQFSNNIIAVYETHPFSKPNEITANVSGNTNFIIEAMANREMGLTQFKNMLETQMKPNIEKPIIVY